MSDSVSRLDKQPLSFLYPTAARALTAGTLLLAIVWSVHYGYVQIFSRFANYDDEGYVMLSLRSYLEGGALFDDVFSQYGPFYYVFKQAIFGLLQLDLTHDNTRLVSLTMWLISSAFCAAAVYRITDSRVVSIVVFLHTVVFMTPIANEPGHPQDLVVLLSVLMIAASTFLCSGRRDIYMLAAMGAIAGALLLTKINIGVYLAVALGAALLQGTVRSKRWTTIYAILTLLLVAIIMREHLISLTTAPYFGLVAISVITVSLAATRIHAQGSPGPKSFAFVASGTAGLILAVSIIQVIRGTSFMGLIEGVLLQPARFANVYSWFLPIPESAVPFGLASAATCIFIISSDVSIAGLSQIQVKTAAAILKLATGVVIISLGLFSHTGMMVERTGAAAVMCFGGPLLWFWLFPFENAEGGWTRWLPRLLLSNFAAIQLLHAYPVAGGQISWAAQPVILAAYVGISDGLKTLFPVTKIGAMKLADSASGSLIVCAFILTTLNTSEFLTVRKEYMANSSLQLAGSERLHLEQEIAAQLHWVTANVRARCDSMVTAPGMGSLHFWSDVPPPTGYNVTLWRTLLNQETQEKIVHRFDSVERPCVVINYETGVHFASDSADQWPLARYFRRELEIGNETRAFGIRIRPDQAGTWESSLLLWKEILFGGNGDIVPVPAELFSSSGTLTLMVISNHDGTILAGQQKAYRRLRPEDGSPFLFITADGRLNARSFGASRTATSLDPINDGQWHHIAVTWREDRQRLFVDGKLLAETELDGSFEAPNFIQFGDGFVGRVAGIGRSNFPFRGSLRDAAIWKRELSEAEIERSSRSSLTK